MSLISQIIAKFKQQTTMVNPKFKFELGQDVQVKGYYAIGYVKARGIMQHLEGHSYNTYIVGMGNETLIRSEQEIEFKK